MNVSQPHKRVLALLNVKKILKKDFDDFSSVEQLFISNHSIQS